MGSLLVVVLFGDGAAAMDAPIPAWKTSRRKGGIGTI
jgi:hypothetical protein